MVFILALQARFINMSRYINAEIDMIVNLVEWYWHGKLPANSSYEDKDTAMYLILDISSSAQGQYPRCTQLVSGWPKIIRTVAWDGMANKSDAYYANSIAHITDDDRVALALEEEMEFNEFCYNFKSYE